MQLNYLRNFIVAAEHKSFAEAAEKLYLSTPALLKQIRVLETELGFLLFTRSRKGISLTDNGKEFYLNVTPLVKALTEEIKKSREKAHAEKKKIVFGAYGSDCKKIVPAVYKAITEKYPGCVFEYKQIEMDEINEKLLDH